MAAKFTKKKTTVAKPAPKKAHPNRDGKPRWKPIQDAGDYLVGIECPLCRVRGYCSIYDNVSSPIIKYACDSCRNLFTAATPPNPFIGRAAIVRDEPVRDPARETWDATIKPVIDDMFAAVVGALHKCADHHTEVHGRSDYHYGVANGIRMAASLLRDAKV